jgi:mRNA interferase MazF
MSRPEAGSIVVVDWRPGQHPEPGALRPGVVVEDSDVFPNSYPMMLVVPLTRDQRLAAPDLAVQLEPTPENGLSTVSWALPHHVSSVALRKARATHSRVATEQLAEIRQRIALSVGIAP